MFVSISVVGKPLNGSNVVNNGETQYIMIMIICMYSAVRMGEGVSG